MQPSRQHGRSEVVAFDPIATTTDGRGWSYGPETDATPKAYSRDGCAPCQGTGKALSSADVALELSGARSLYDGIDDFQATTGGLTVVHYPSRAALDKHGLAAALKAAVG